MFITAVCVIFLIKLRWPKNKSLYEDYLANEIKGGMSVYRAQVSWSMRFARPSICRQNLSQV